MRLRPSLWRRSVSLFALSGSIPILIGGALALWLSWDQLIEEAQQRHLSLARAVALQVRGVLSAHEVALRHLAGIMADPSSRPLLRYHLEALEAQGIALQGAVLVDTQGRAQQGYPQRGDLLGRDYAAFSHFISALETGRTAYSNVHIPVGFQEPMVVLGVPVEGGVALGFVPLAPINQRIQELTIGVRAWIVLTDGKGIVASHPDQTLVAQRENLSGMEPVAMALQGKEGSVRYSHREVRYLGAAAVVPELGWPVAVVEEESSAVSILKELVAPLLGALGGALALSFIMGLLSTNRLLGPVLKLTRALKRVSEGNYSARMEKPSFQELQGLYGAFDLMVRKVQEREKALMAAADQWRLTFDAVPDPIWLLDKEHRILKLNRAGSMFLGHHEGEVLGRRCFEVVHGTEFPPEDCPHVLSMSDGQAHTAEQKALGRELLVSTAPVVDASGSLVGSVHVARDITELKRMQEAIRDSEKRYKLVVENAYDAIVVLQDGLIKFVNQRAAELAHSSPQDVQLRPFAEFVHPDDRKMVLDYYQARLRGEEVPPKYNLRVRGCSPRDYRWVELRAVGITWEGRPATLNFLTDITERLKAEEALRQSEERYRSLVENSPDGIFMAELPSGRIRFVNDEVCRMLGFQRQEALELTFWDVLPVEETSKVKELVQRVLSGGELPKESISVKGLRKDRTPISLDVRAALINYQGEELVQGIVRDTTEQDRLQRQLQHAQRMEALGTLAAGVAHEFNNILASMRGFAELWLMDLEGKNLLAESETHYGKEILAGCDRAGALTRRMLTLARVEAGDRCPLKVNQVAEAVERLLRQTVAPNVSIKLSLSRGLPFVMADPTQLEQVILNLAVNARDAMPEGGTLCIGTRYSLLDHEFCRRYPYAVPGNYVEIFVEDDGVGIPEELRERIFDPFFTTKEAGKGTGLGLSVSYSIVKAHDGYIIVQSPPDGKDRGSLFRIFLPPVEVEGDQGVPEKEPSSPPRGEGERILVVDDETRVRQILDKVLEANGYEVALAANGEEAVRGYVEALERGQRFQAVILDMAMPVKDGRWAMAEILKVDPSAKVMIVTGYIDEEWLDEELRARARAILHKPFDMSILLGTLRECLDKG